MSDEKTTGSFAEAFDEAIDDATQALAAADAEQAEADQAAIDAGEAVEQPVQEADYEAAVEADAEAPAEKSGAEEEDAEYKARLRKFTRELKKQPGQWYIVQCYSGYENKVKTNLDMRAQTLEVEDSIYEVVVPIEQALEIRDGKRKLVKRKLLPGYVLVRMDINDRAWSVVRDTPGVTSFVGNEGNATAVKHRDVAKFLMPQESVAGEAEAVNADGEKVVAMPGESTKPKVTVDYQVGEAVTILTGALAGVSASINEIDHENGKIQALVSIFGRETPVELNFDQVEKVS